MATFTKRGNSWRAQVYRNGIRQSETFPSKGAAVAWAGRLEAEIIAGDRGEIPDKLFGDLLARYRDSISPNKKGARWEVIRLNRVLGTENPAWRMPNTPPPAEPQKPDPIALVHLKDMDSKPVSEWRDRRLAAGLKPSSVRREWNQLSSACGVAVGEWKWLRKNPFGKAAGAKRPSNGKHRTELIQEADMAVLQAVADDREANTYRQVMRTVRFANETAMRASEIIFLSENPERVDTAIRVAHLPDTKNGNARDVPLSLEAIRLWNEAAAEPRVEGRGIFGLTSSTLDTHWRALRDLAALMSAPVKRLHFHDTRHTAITRLSKKLDVLDLARVTGHTNLNELMTYYNASAADIARKL